MEPQYMDDFSANTTEMRTTSDPGESGAESLATSLQGEIERLRFAILEIKQALDSGLNYWYESPTTNTTTGPTSSTDNAITRFNGTTGAVQNSNIIITDLDVLTLSDTTITTSGSSTTYSTTTVADASAWDLSGVIAGDVVSAGGSLGVVSSVNDGSDTITVTSWDNGTPANSSVATVLRRAKLDLSTNAENLLLDDLENVMDAGFANAAFDNTERAFSNATDVGPRGIRASSSSGAFGTSSTSAVDVTNLTCDFTVSGNRPIRMELQPASGTAECYVSAAASDNNASGHIYFVANGVTYGSSYFGTEVNGGTLAQSIHPVLYFTIPQALLSAGTYTFKIQTKVGALGGSVLVNEMKLVVHEL